MMSKCSITIKGEGLLVDREVSSELAEKLALMVLEKQSDRANGVVEKVEDTQDDDLASFLKDSGASRSVERIVAIGWWLKNKNNLSVFGGREIREMLEISGYGVPKNLSRDLAWSVSVGWIVRKDGQRGAYYLSQKGKEVVEAGFSEDVVAGTVVRRKGKEVKK